MRSLTGLILCFSGALAMAQSPELRRRYPSPLEIVEQVPRTVFEASSSYVFGSDLDNFGKQGAVETDIGVGQRFLLKGNFFLRLGVDYHRFDFGQTDAPVPDHLQSMTGLIGIEYMRGKHVGALFYAKPGFYTEDAIGLDSFDIPMTIASAIVLQKEKLYLFVGATSSFLRGNLPVLPLAGVIWCPSKQIRFMGIVPHPRLIYSPNKTLDLWIGGELVGGSFRTDHDQDIRPRKLSGAQVDYSDYRAGIGLTYSPSDLFNLDLAAGYSLQRSFDFERAGQDYDAEPAPYVRVSIDAKF